LYRFWERVKTEGRSNRAIAPGIIDTPMWDVVDREFARLENLPVGEKKRQVSQQIPFGRMGRPEEVAGCAVFLAAEDSDYVIAQTYGVDGGNWMAYSIIAFSARSRKELTATARMIRSPMTTS
jgi:NAD(P)-dependent dehydrogenase (short-subunit alcohol dehydrogenase family)